MTRAHIPTILIIDNDDAVARSLALRLGSLRYNCLVVGNGDEGIEAFRSRQIDLIITDLNMPCIDGIGVVQRIRSSSNVPIIIMTGYQREYVEELDQLEHVVVLRKPFRASVIIDLVEAELALHCFCAAA